MGGRGSALSVAVINGVAVTRDCFEPGLGGTPMAIFHMIADDSDAGNRPAVRRIELADVRSALTKGFDDFWAMPSQVVFLGLIYPVVGVVLGVVTSDENALPLLFPLVSGFALVGPFAAIGLYEMSRRRELGLDTSWRHAFEVLRSSSIWSILSIGLLLTVIFLIWLATAQALYQWLFGPDAPESYSQFLYEVLSTPKGWALIVLGNAIGFAFAIVTLSVSVVSFPLLLDRDVGARVAILTSVRAVLMNPVMMMLWGLILVALLVIGSLPLLVGLSVVMPVLGHSTWHFYRRVVEPRVDVEAKNSQAVD
jgi:uncharacterized membrane protein